MSKNNIKVSICCTAYNHEKYIDAAIKSFLNQETDFDYEIIINDDASLDGTKEIIKRYAKQYPEKIVPIYQKINQYSTGGNVLDITFKKAKGEYIAICEGDDYWIDSKKLQDQVNYLEKNKKCSLCVTNGIKIDEEGKKLGQFNPYNKNTLINMEKYIQRKNSYPTASMAFPRNLITNLPDYYYGAPVGDIPLQIFLLTKGYGYYMDSITSVYRCQSQYSWSSSFNKSKEKRIDHYERMIEIYNSINKDTNNKYKEYIDYLLLKAEFKLQIVKENYNIVLNKKYKKVFKSYSLLNKIKFLFKAFFPSIYKKTKKD